MSNLRSQLEGLAASFAESVLEAIRSSSIDDLVGQAGPAPRERRAPRESAPAAEARPAARSGRPSNGRLPRRSTDDIEAELTKIVSLLKSRSEGMRAEQIRQELGLQAKELPRVLKQGLTSKALRSKGQKRATTYFAR